METATVTAVTATAGHPSTATMRDDDDCRGMTAADRAWRMSGSWISRDLLCSSMSADLPVPTHWRDLEGESVDDDFSIDADECIHHALDRGLDADVAQAWRDRVLRHMRWHSSGSLPFTMGSRLVVQ